jgi:WD40 repeat protein
VWCVAFSPDGRQLTSGGDDGVVRVWDLHRPAQPRLLRGHHGPAWSLAYSPDGRLLASAGHDGSLRVWQPANGTELVALRGHGAFVEQVRFSPDGRLLTGHGDGTVRLSRCEFCGPVDEVRARADSRTTRKLTPDEIQVYLQEAWP